MTDSKMNDFPSVSPDLPDFMAGIPDTSSMTGKSIPGMRMSQTGMRYLSQTGMNAGGQNTGNWMSVQTGNFAQISGTWEAINSDPEFMQIVGDRGEMSDRYRLEGQLGVGGNAFVYEGYRLSDNMHVVIKIMRIPMTFEHDELILTIKRFYREAAMVASLENEHIRKCLDYGLFHGIPAMVLELVDGLTLTQLIQNYGSLPLSYATGIIEQLLGALDEPHRRGIIHRDIKPANIMVFDSPPPYEIRVLDFGIATVLSAIPNKSMMTQKGVIRGTPSYMAPELFTGETPASIESDLFAVGLVYLECLTGKVAVDATSYMKVAYKQVNDPLEIPGFIPASIADIILKLCAKSPMNRYHSAIQVLEDIHNCIDDALREETKYVAEWQKNKTYRTLTTKDSMKSVSPDALKKNRKPLFAIVAAVAIAVIIGLIFAVSGKQEPVQQAAAPAPVPAVQAPQEPSPDAIMREQAADAALNAANEAAAAAAAAAAQLNETQQQMAAMKRKNTLSLVTTRTFSAWNMAIASWQSSQKQNEAAKIKRPTKRPSSAGKLPTDAVVPQPERPSNSGRNVDTSTALPF